MSKIKVALRTRPLSTREISENNVMVVQVAEKTAFITDIRVPEKPAADSRHRLRKFDFDHTFWLTHSGDHGASQEEVYNEMGPCLEKSVLEGYNACLLAYGQSGTGKTHTMLGTKTAPGLIPRLCQSIWSKLKANVEINEISTFRMEVSFMEIYREKVRDLLSQNKQLKIREHPSTGPHVQDLTKVQVTEEIGIADLLWEGETRRAIAQNSSNRRSSRSHCIWTVYIQKQLGPNYDQQLITNQIQLVDLAGSEKAELTTSKNLLAEGADINRSLVSLGNVISSLAEKAQYVPYRDSALTWLLKDSVGGNATTSIIITASPGSSCHAQTLNSFRFAQRARLVENLPTINLTSASHRTDSNYIASLFDIRKDIARLANILKVAQSNGGILRGLTPRNGWNRLIEAIESWNHVEKRNLHRATSTDTSTSTTLAPTKSSSTMTSASTKSLNDVMTQVDIQCYEDARACPSSSVSVPTSPCHQKSNNNNNLSASQEVFIPKSSESIKCLTWSQSEIESIPEVIPSDSEEEYISPPQTPKVYHLKNVFPVHFPTTHNLDFESRMKEMNSYFNCNYLSPQQAFPRQVEEDCENRCLIRNRIPTLVNSQPMNIFACTESSALSSTSNCSHSNSPCGDTDFDFEFQEFEFSPKPRLVVTKGAGKKRIHRSASKIKEFASAKPVPLQLLESSDENEFSDCLEIELNQSANKNLRTVDFQRQVIVDDAKTPLVDNDEMLQFGSESVCLNSSASSSYASLIFHKPVGPVKVVESSKCVFNDDHVSEFQPKDLKLLEKRVATVFVKFGKEIQEDHNCEKVDQISETFGANGPSVTMDHKKMKKPFDGSTSTKFRNFYIRELQKLEQIGKQIKSLQLLAQRYDVLKPYLKKLEELQNENFLEPDPQLDAQIEHCSGWNVDIEFNKVQSEVLAISKILKNNSNSVVGKLPRRDSSSASNRSNLTSSTSINSDPDSLLMNSPTMDSKNSRRNSAASSNVFEPNLTLSSRGTRSFTNSLPPRKPTGGTVADFDKNYNKNRNGSSSSSPFLNFNLSQKQQKRENKKSTLSGGKNLSSAAVESRKNFNAPSNDFSHSRGGDHRDRKEHKNNKMEFYYRNGRNPTTSSSYETNLQYSDNSVHFLNESTSNQSSFTSSNSFPIPTNNHNLDNYNYAPQSHRHRQQQQQQHNPWKNSSSTLNSVPNSSQSVTPPPYAYSFPTFKNDHIQQQHHSQRYPTTMSQQTTGFFVPPYTQFHNHVGYSSTPSDKIGPRMSNMNNINGVKSTSQQFNVSLSAFPFSRPPQQPPPPPAQDPFEFLTQDYGFMLDDETQNESQVDTSDFSSGPSQYDGDNKYFDSFHGHYKSPPKFQSTSSPYTSLSFETNMRPNTNSYCKHCSTEFCSCPESLGSSKMNDGDHRHKMGLGEFLQNKIKSTNRPFGSHIHSRSTNIYTNSPSVSYN